VKVRYLPGDVFVASGIEVPDQLPIRGIEEGDFEALPIAGAIGCSPSVSLRLLKYILGIYCDLFGFNDGQKLTTDEERVVSGTIICWVFLHRHAVKACNLKAGAEFQNCPWWMASAKARIYTLLSGPPLQFVYGHEPGHNRICAEFTHSE
jgi:hypothetical protein